MPAATKSRPRRRKRKAKSFEEVLRDEELLASYLEDAAKARRGKGKKHPVHLSKREADRLGFYFDEAAADRVCRFFEEWLVFIDGPESEKPYRLMPWWRDEILRPLFGWKRKKDGTRRFRRAGIWVAKKNAKTFIGAGLMLYGMMADTIEHGGKVREEFAAGCYCAARSIEQASILFDSARDMVLLSPHLKKRLTVRDTRKEILNRPRRSFMKVLSSMPEGAEGLKTHFCFYDEIHVAPNMRLFSALKKGGSAREQPLFVTISTAGEFDPESLGWKQWDYAKRVLDGTIPDPTFFPFIAAAESTDDWEDPATWAKANPSAGQSIKWDTLAEEALEAKYDQVSLTDFRRRRLNVWVGAMNAYFSPERWHRLADPGLTMEAMRGRPCFVGVDLSQTTDLTAMVFLFPPHGEDLLWSVIPQFYTPRESLIERARSDMVDFVFWSDEGHLKVTPGEVVDYSFLQKSLEDAREIVDIQVVGYDGWNARTWIQGLEKAGWDNLQQIIQGPKTLNDPMKEMDRLVKSRAIRHDGNPVMEWNVANCVAKTDPNLNVGPDKKNSKGRIDGVSGLLTAFAACWSDEDTKKVVMRGRSLAAS